MQQKGEKAERVVKLYSYVVEHDTGRAPNPYFGVCTLCRCKYRSTPKKPRNVVELAKEGDWIVGTGGADTRKSAGHGKVVYAMRVDEKVTREKYYTDRRFAKKRVVPTGDNERPTNSFQRCKQYALISWHFYYFGAKAIPIPRRFSDLEKEGPGFKKNFDSAYISSFVEWLEKNHKPGKHGEPWMKPTDRSKGSKGCRSSC
ncbi:MAG: hypothetical protein ABSG26_26060 [Bryobacteraceae bacterium]|jgi:hypothetical protein